MIQYFSHCTGSGNDQRGINHAAPHVRPKQSSLKYIPYLYIFGATLDHFIAVIQTTPMHLVERCLTQIPSGCDFLYTRLHSYGGTE